MPYVMCFPSFQSLYLFEYIPSFPIFQSRIIIFFNVILIRNACNACLIILLMLFQTIADLSEQKDGTSIVTTDWLHECLQKKKLLKTDDYEIS